MTEKPLFWTHFSLSALYVWAISGTSGSSGFGSQRREQMDNKTGKQYKNRKTLDSQVTKTECFLKKK